MAHKLARWLHNPCRLGAPHRLRAGGRIRNGPQVAKVATQPLPPGGIPTVSERGAESELAHKWATWLHNTLPLGESPPPQGGGQNQKWQQSEMENLIFWGHTTKHGFQSGGTISEIAHNWAQWQYFLGKKNFPLSNLLNKNIFY